MTDDEVCELHMAVHSGPKGPLQDAALVLLAEVKRQRERIAQLQAKLQEWADAALQAHEAKKATLDKLPVGRPP